jgi:hypothetical protein
MTDGFEMAFDESALGVMTGPTGDGRRLDFLLLVASSVAI